MEIREGRQSNPVADEVGALVAVTRPVIAGVLQSISEEVVNTVGERSAGVMPGGTPAMLVRDHPGRTRWAAAAQCR
jgi:hypothetical protein